MVSTPHISESSCPLIHPLVSLPMFHSLLVFQFPSKVWVFISFFVFLQFYPVVSRNGLVHYSAGSIFFFYFLFFFFFLLTIAKSGCLAEIRWSVCITKSQRIFCEHILRRIIIIININIIIIIIIIIVAVVVVVFTLALVDDISLESK